jgi:hypothetical protein
MSGGTLEYTAAYVNNSNLVNGSNLTSAAGQYKDIYSVAATDTRANNYALTINKKGDAIYEISDSAGDSRAWYNDDAYMPNTTGPGFARGGSNYNMQNNSGTFCFGGSDGAADSMTGFRPVLLVGTGL